MIQLKFFSIQTNKSRYFLARRNNTSVKQGDGETKLLRFPPEDFAC